jgi:bifunctional ADP-heptose synthase (sugar kinase/adenylyltransferase)
VDTRTKIITLEDAAALVHGGRPAVLVTGHFDVLLAAHVHEVGRVRAGLPDAVLLVALTTPEQPVLDARARAEMVAALEVVDYVVSLDDQQMQALLAAFPADRIVRLEAAHEPRRRELIQHVHRRQSG